MLVLHVNFQIIFLLWFEVTRFTIESFLFGLQMLNRISLRTFFQHDETLCTRVFYITLGVGWHFFTWRCRLLLSVKSLSQYLHCFRGAPVWISMCSFRYCFWENVFSQVSHLYRSRFSSWHLVTCACKLSVLRKVFAHIWHVNTLLLSAWTLLCLAKFPFLNIFPHSPHFISSCNWLLCWFNLDPDTNVFFTLFTGMFKHGLGDSRKKFKLP